MTSPEKEDRYYTTRGSLGFDDNGKLLINHLKEDKKNFVWPKLFITLSNKEKEEDFLAMKGCKPSQRPKKRAKLIQRSILVLHHIKYQISIPTRKYLNTFLKLGKSIIFLIWDIVDGFAYLILFVHVQLVSPGAWLSDLCRERYEVREKRTSKKVTLN